MGLRLAIRQNEKEINKLLNGIDSQEDELDELEAEKQELCGRLEENKFNIKRNKELLDIHGEEFDRLNAEIMELTEYIKNMEEIKKGLSEKASTNQSMNRMQNIPFSPASGGRSTPQNFRKSPKGTPPIGFVTPPRGPRKEYSLRTPEFSPEPQMSFGSYSPKARVPRFRAPMGCRSPRWSHEASFSPLAFSPRKRLLFSSEEDDSRHDSFHSPGRENRFTFDFPSHQVTSTPRSPARPPAARSFAPTSPHRTDRTFVASPQLSRTSPTKFKFQRISSKPWDI